ncbi:MAG: hypothetical protein ACHQ50_10060 [Fimbriimonadales bacterium]
MLHLDFLAGKPFEPLQGRRSIGGLSSPSQVSGILDDRQWLKGPLDLSVHDLFERRHLRPWLNRRKIGKARNALRGDAQKEGLYFAVTM